MPVFIRQYFPPLFSAVQFTAKTILREVLHCSASDCHLCIVQVFRDSNMTISFSSEYERYPSKEYIVSVLKKTKEEGRSEILLPCSNNLFDLAHILQTSELRTLLRMRRADASWALIRWGTFLHGMTSRPPSWKCGWHQIQNPTRQSMRILREEHSCRISSPSCLKRRSLRLFWRGCPNNNKNKMIRDMRSVSDPETFWRTGQLAAVTSNFSWRHSTSDRVSTNV